MFLTFYIKKYTKLLLYYPIHTHIYACFSFQIHIRILLLSVCQKAECYSQFKDSVFIFSFFLFVFIVRELWQNKVFVTLQRRNILPLLISHLLLLRCSSQMLSMFILIVIIIIIMFQRLLM